MKVKVLGATGTAGRAAIPVLVAAGHDVFGHARTDSAAAAVAVLGDTPVRADTDDPDELRAMLTGADAVVDLRVAIPPATRAALPLAWREYARLRDTGTGLVVDAALRAGVQRVIHDTVTMVYADGGDAQLDEDSPVDATGALVANLAAERHLARLSAAGGTGVALRFAQFYGPDDRFSRELMSAARRGRALLAGRPEGWTSALHTDDVGQAVLVALTAPAGFYNVVDDEPLRRRDVLDLLAQSAARTVRPFPAWTSSLASAPVRALARSQRVSAARFRALGWRPSVPSRRQGWPEAFAAFTSA